MRGLDHAGVGFAPRVVVYRISGLTILMIGAGINGIDRCAGLFQLTVDFVLNGNEIAPFEKSTANASLVCDHDHRNALAIEARDRLGSALCQRHILNRFEVVPLFDNHAIAIEE